MTIKENKKIEIINSVETLEGKMAAMRVAQ